MRLMLNTLVSLTLILSGTPSAKAQNLKIPSGNSLGDSTCFDLVEMKSLATYKKSCDVCKLDLEDTNKTLSACAAVGSSEEKWWSDPKFVIGGFVVSFSVGVALATLLR